MLSVVAIVDPEAKVTVVPVPNGNLAIAPLIAVIKSCTVEPLPTATVRASVSCP